jgi:hypothetical protein
MYNYKAHKNKGIINIFLYLTFHNSYNLQLCVQDTSAIFIQVSSDIALNS